MLDDLEEEGGTLLGSKGASFITRLLGPGDRTEFSFLRCKKRATVFSFQYYWGDLEITRETCLHARHINRRYCYILSNYFS